MHAQAFAMMQARFVVVISGASDDLTVSHGLRTCRAHRSGRPGGRAVARAARARDVSVYVIVRHALPTHEVGGLARALARRARRDPPARDSAFEGGGSTPQRETLRCWRGGPEPPARGSAPWAGVLFFPRAGPSPPEFDVRKAVVSLVYLIRITLSLGGRSVSLAPI